MNAIKRQAVEAHNARYEESKLKVKEEAAKPRKPRPRTNAVYLAALGVYINAYD